MRFMVVKRGHEPWCLGHLEKKDNVGTNVRARGNSNEEPHKTGCAAKFGVGSLKRKKESTRIHILIATAFTSTRACCNNLKKMEAELMVC